MVELPFIRVSVLLAEARRQAVRPLEVPPGTSAWQAVERSRLLHGRDDLDPEKLAVAVHGRLVGRERPLEDGDRVEILRPLPQDPRQRRRRLASEGGAMGRRRRGSGSAPD